MAVTGLVLAQAWLLARAIAGATEGMGPDDLSWVIAAVAAVALARAALSYGAETAALRSAARAKSELRRRLVAHVTGTRANDVPGDTRPPGPGAVWLSGQADPDQGTSAPSSASVWLVTTKPSA